MYRLLMCSPIDCHDSVSYPSFFYCCCFCRIIVITIASELTELETHSLINCSMYIIIIIIILLIITYHKVTIMRVRNICNFGKLGL